MHFDPAETIERLAPWDVIYPFDDRARPEKWKMWVCVSKENLWFYRVNSRSNGDFCVPLASALHRFLEWDSYFGGSGDLIEVVEFDLLDLLAKQRMPERQGIVGSIYVDCRPDIWAAIRGNGKLSPVRLRAIAHELGQSLAP